MNWDDLRFVLAVADHGSVSAAARVLGVTHATVLRRVAGFEAAHGGEVFDKSPTGYRIKSGRQRVIDAARDVAEAVGSVDRLMHGARAPVRGVVRISSTDTFCQFVLPPLIRRMQNAAPELQLELLSSNHHVDIGRLQADVSVRPAMALPDDMTGEVAADLAFCAYAARNVDGPWLGLQGPLARSAAGVWMAAEVGKDQIAGAADSFVVLSELARLGLGVAVLPALIGDAVPDLIRRADLMPQLTTPVWVATHVDLSDAPRIQLARRHVFEFLRQCAPRLAGHPGA